MKSFLDPIGVYNPLLRFAFTNITQEDFVSAWDGNPVTVRPGETVEVPEYLAVKFTGELVDKIMLQDVKLNEVNYYKQNPNAAANTYRAPNSVGVPAARKPWEDKIIQQLEVDEESSQVQVYRAQLKAELSADLKAETSTAPVPVPTSIEEFADLDKSNAPKLAKAPLKVAKV